MTSSPADLPVVLQRLILDYVDNCTFADLKDLAQQDEESSMTGLGWLGPICTELELERRQKQQLPAMFLRHVMSCLDVLHSVIYDLPQYKIDYHWAITQVSSYEIAFWGYEMQHRDRMAQYDGVRKLLFKRVDSTQRLSGRNGLVGLGLEWLGSIHHSVTVREVVLDLVDRHAKLRRESIHAMLFAGSCLKTRSIA